jgi:hypothetical protein
MGAEDHALPVLANPVPLEREGRAARVLCGFNSSQGAAAALLRAYGAAATATASVGSVPVVELMASSSLPAVVVSKM